MDIRFDRHSLILDGRRRLLIGGAFHYYRLPAPALWRDRLRQIVSAGYNAVDLYFAWNYHSPAPGVYDFEGPRNVERLLNLTQELGLWVLARPGPYINSELDGGGLPAWVLRNPEVDPRCLRENRHQDSSAFLAAVREWYGQIVPKFARRPNVILVQVENEYSSEDMATDYMVALRDLQREFGVTVPTFHNDLWAAGLWAGVVDVYGVDDYAIKDFSTDWRHQPDLYATIDRLEETQNEVAPHNSVFIPELQSGWYASWEEPGYERIREMLGPEQINVATLSLLGQGSTMYSHYMFCGGTNWDRIGCPTACTSYDFAAPVTEWGGLSARYDAAKTIAGTLNALEDVFAVTELADDVTCSDPDVLYRIRRHGESRLVYLRNMTGETRSFTLRFPAPTVADAAGALTTRALTIPTGDMRLALANVRLGGLLCRYVTSNVFLQSTGQAASPIDGTPSACHLVAFAGPGEVVWDLAVPENAGAPASALPEFWRDALGADVRDGRLRLSYEGDTVRELVFGWNNHVTRAVFLPSTHNAWVSEGRLILGPEDLDGTDPRRLVAYTSEETRALIYTAGTAAEVRPRLAKTGHLVTGTWRTATTQTTADAIAGKTSVWLSAPPPVQTPELGPWSWTVANPELGNDADIPWQSFTGGGNMDFDSLGFDTGYGWYRADYTGRMAAIDLAVRHQATVYLNGHFVTAVDGYDHGEDFPPEPKTIALPAELQTDGANSLRVLVESLGRSRGFDSDLRSPRGLLAATPTWADPAKPPTMLRWTLARTAGERAGWPGQSTLPGGWYHAERLADIARSALEQQGQAADLLWARTEFTLAVPEDTAAPMGLHARGVAERMTIWINGTLIARDWSICPQRTFYLPDGVLNPHGSNRLDLLLWRRGQIAVEVAMELRPYQVLRATTVVIS